MTVKKAAVLQRVATGEHTPPPMHVPLKTPLLTSVPVFQRQDDYRELQVGLHSKILSQAKAHDCPAFPVSS